MRLQTDPKQMDEKPDNQIEEMVVDDCRFVRHEPRGRFVHVRFEWTWSTPKGEPPHDEPHAVSVAFLPEDDEGWFSDAWRTFLEALHDSGLPQEDLGAILDAGDVGDIEDVDVRRQQSEMFRDALVGKRFRSDTEAFSDDPAYTIRVLSEYLGDAGANLEGAGDRAAE